MGLHVVARYDLIRVCNEAIKLLLIPDEVCLLHCIRKRAKKMLTLGDIGAARLLLERAANAQDATAAFLLARTYDPSVLGSLDTRSIIPDARLARDWYRKAAGLGSPEAQKRLTRLQN